MSAGPVLPAGRRPRGTKDPRRFAVGPFMVAYIAAFRFQPVAAGPFREVAVIAGGSILFCAFTVIACRLLPGVDSWADIGLRRADPLRWWVAALLTAATSLGYVAIQELAQRVGDLVGAAFGFQRTSITALAIPNPAEIPADLIRSVHTAVLEELLCFAVPLAIGALTWRWARGRWFPIRLERRFIAIATGLAIVGLRAIGHQYWGFPGLLASVIPWMLGAWLVFRLCGTVWPLIVGHIVFDVLVFAQYRLPDTQWPPAAYAAAVLVGTCVLFGGPTVLSLSPLRMFRR